MAGIDREWREHRENFFLEITLGPCRALGAQLRDFVKPDTVLGQGRHQFLVPEFVLRRDQLVRDALDRVECLRWRHPVWADIARFALDLLLDARNANLEELIKVRAEDRHELDALDQRLRRVLGFFENAAVKLEPA